MKRHAVCAAAAACIFPLLGCSSDIVSTGSGGSGGAPGGAGPGGGGQASCDALSSDEAPQPVTITVANQTGMAIYLDEQCGGFLQVDDNAIDRDSCGDYLDGQYCSPLDCFPEFPTSIADGQTLDYEWDGRVPGAEELPLPEPCRPMNDCGGNFEVDTCEPAIVAPAGDHVVTLRYQTVDDPLASSSTSTTTITLPATSVTVTVMP